jgi:hypothetical protein
MQTYVMNKINYTKDHYQNIIQKLQHKMEVVIPHVEDDQIMPLLKARYLGCFASQKSPRRFFHKWWKPERAIQTTTAAPLAQAAQLLLETPIAASLTSQIDPNDS